MIALVSSLFNLLLQIRLSRSKTEHDIFQAANTQNKYLLAAMFASVVLPQASWEL